MCQGSLLNVAHLRNGKSNGLALGGNENDLLVGRNVLLEPQETGNHELGAVADGIDGRVLDDNALVRRQKSLEGLDDAAQGRLVATVVVLPLSIKNVVEGNHLSVVLPHGTTAHTAQLLHVRADAEKQAQVDAEGSDVGSGLARHPEDAEVAVVVELDQAALVDGSDTELALDGRNERGALEEGARELLESLGKGSLAALDLVVETDDADVLLAGTLLGLDESSGAVNADNWSLLALTAEKGREERTQAASDLGVESTRVARLLNTAESVSTAVHHQQTGLVPTEASS